MQIRTLWKHPKSNDTKQTTCKRQSYKMKNMQKRIIHLCKGLKKPKKNVRESFRYEGQKPQEPKRFRNITKVNHT